MINHTAVKENGHGHGSFGLKIYTISFTFSIPKASVYPYSVFYRVDNNK